MNNKKITKLLLFIAFLLAMLYTFLLAANAEIVKTGTYGAEGDGNNIIWAVDDSGTLTISGNGYMQDWQKTSESPWWDTKIEIKNIVIKDGVKTIGAGAFQNMKGITTITFPDSVISIGENAFYNCENISIIKLPSQIRNIGARAFDRTSWYNTQPDGIIYIDNVLYGYKGILTQSKIEIEEGTTVIAGNAFMNCSTLTSVIIPESVISICSHAFSGCSKLSDISIPQNVTFVGDSAFNNTLWHNNLGGGLIYVGKVLYEARFVLPSNHIEIKMGTTEIAPYAFFHQRELKEITLPDSMEYIGNNAFQYCENLEFVNIPKSVIYVDKYAFTGCSELKTAEIENEYCHIASYEYKAESYTFPVKTKIHGYDNSTAQKYALQHGNTFITILKHENSQENYELLYGDVDGDGKLSSADARLALRASVGLTEKGDVTPGSAGYLAADVNGDGKVGSDDARLILRASVGLEDASKWKK